MTRIVLASNNAGKVAELSALLAPLALDIVPGSEFSLASPEENGLSFIENALIKARYAAGETGLPAIADDSGLCIDALGGAPGIYSSRFAGEHGNDKKNIDKALTELKEIPDEDRGAQFHCVLAYVSHAKDMAPIVCHGVWPGKILTAPQGDGGFGYDPIFYVPTHDCSAAELPSKTKNQISHRARALALFKEALKAAISG